MIIFVHLFHPMVKIENEILKTNSPSWTIWLAGPWKHQPTIRVCNVCSRNEYPMFYDAYVCVVMFAHEYEAWTNYEEQLFQLSL
jgi:hypothetical protein